MLVLLAALALQAQATAPPPDLPPIAGAAGPAYRASEQDRRAVIEATLAYLRAKDGGRYAEAWAMLTPANQRLFPLANWTEQARAFNAEAGAAGARRLTRLTWYDNPPVAEEPGIYAALDFTGAFANYHFMCGFLMWQRQPDGSWRVEREQESMVSRAELPNPSPELLAGLRQRYHCQD